MAHQTGMRRRTRCNLATITSLVLVLVAAPSTYAQIPGKCETPVSERSGEIGCYLTATEVLKALPQEQVYWHLYMYPARAAAEAAKGPNGTVVESFGKIWLYTIAEETWHPTAGERAAVLGPFPIIAGRQYIARYMEAAFTPDMQTRAHTHSGPEAWYLVSGVQCLETPDGVRVARAGEGAVVPEGPPMALSSVGTETRKSVLLVLHEASRPWIAFGHDWQPKGLCPK